MIVILLLLPRKIRQLVKDLEKAGFEFEPAKGSHRKYTHDLTTDVVIIYGQIGDDASPYQEKHLRVALENLRKAKE